LAPFELAEPRSLGEALTLLTDDSEATVRPMGGGTALMLMMKAGVLRPTRLVNLRRLGLDGIERAADGSLRVGAMVPLRKLETSDVLRRGWPVIARTLRTLSNVRVRNVATVGGHLAHGDPHMDLPPLLSALGATVTIYGPTGERRASVEQLYAGYDARARRADHAAQRAAHGRAACRVSQMHDALGRRLAGARHGSSAGSEKREHRGQRRDR
jgi:carbon-monoxide dehydrogenase medium subunit